MAGVGIRRIVAGVLGAGLLLAGAFLGRQAPPADAQRVEPGGAPPPGSGPFEVTGAVRVIDGDTVEAWVQGKRTGIGLLGISAPMGNTPCGRQATAQLWGLVRGGVRLVDDPSVTFDAERRRMFHVTGRDGRSLAEEQVRAGLAQPDGRGPDRDRLAAAAAEARAAGRGCVWQGQAGEAGAPHATLAAALGPGDGPLARGASKAMAAPLEALPATFLTGGFTEEIVASGLTQPTAFTFLADGRILVAEKDGLVKVVKNGALLPTPLIDIRDRVNDYWDHGLIGIAAHPNFTTNPYVYLMYTYENNPGDYSGRKTGRLARYTVSGDTADPASETVLLGTQVGESCNLFPAGADCIPSDSPSHSVGSLKFAADGTLFVSLGDGAHFNLVDDDALRAQNLDLLAGKLLRITADGQGVPGGPFWNGSGAANRSKVWGLGLRNPYRFTLRPLAGGGTGLPYLGDVGWNTWEEINVPPAGANMGWPCYEGTARQSGYEPKSVCQALYAQGSGAVKAPLVSWDHSAGSSAATGGAFYTGTSYPAAYQGAYVYGDYGQNWMRSLRVDGDNILVSGPTDFATDAQGPVAIEAGPDGDLHYLAIVAGQLRRVRYTGGSDPVSCTTGQYRAEYFNNRTLSGSPAFTRCETSISYDWGGGGPGFGVGPDNFSVRWTGRHQLDAGNYTFTARADDGIRLWLDGALLIDAWYDQPVTTYTASRTVTGGEHEVKVEYYENGGGAIAQVSWAPSTNQSPAATITSPAPALRFKVGDVIAFSGSATDAEDGTVPASRLTWEVRLHHCPAFGPSCHAHLFTTATGTGGTITAPDHGDGSYFEFVLTATDSAGLTDTESVSVQPQTVQLTLATAPSGLEVVYDGTAGVAPLTRTTIVGSSHTIQVSSPQGGLVFVSWSDGGAMQHNVTAGAADTTYTATFASPTATPTAPPGPTPSATPSMSPTATTTATATTPSPTPTRTPVVTATPTLTPTPGAPGGAHVGDLDGAATGTRNEWTARVTVAIHDAAENPVAGATVQGSWSSGQPAGASCTTDSAGRCSVTSGSIPRRTDRVTFTVTGVSHTLPYAAAGNHDPDGDSDGTRVTVVKP